MSGNIEAAGFGVTFLPPGWRESSSPTLDIYSKL